MRETIKAPGDKGKVEGNPYASSYYGTAGLGGKGSGFGLNGRSLQNQGSVTQECNQEGVVVVRITVDKNGNVVAQNRGKGYHKLPSLFTRTRQENSLFTQVVF